MVGLFLLTKYIHVSCSIVCPFCVPIDRFVPVNVGFAIRQSFRRSELRIGILFAPLNRENNVIEVLEPAYSFCALHMPPISSKNNIPWVSRAGGTQISS